MNTRSLNKLESYKLKEINRAGIECALIFLTSTGLNKSIIDATQPVRKLLRKLKIHDYNFQEQGPDHKIQLPAFIFCGSKYYETFVSLYRPKTKKGDPRIWPKGLKSVANVGDVLACFSLKGTLCFLNLSYPNLVEFDDESKFAVMLDELKGKYNLVSDELLFKIKKLVQEGPLKACGTGSTAIGRTIETNLGIAINSSPMPDYKGIEIKSRRSGVRTRSNLFAQVANWDLSNYKSSRELLEEFGYQNESEEFRRLYCTVSTNNINKQGLFFDLDLNNNFLNEMFRYAEQDKLVLVWDVNKLHEKLNQKHKETFWITAKEININSSVYFEFESIKHTRKPSTFQFDRLLASGDITMDHLISNKKGVVKEKGPLFKIKPDSVDELFLGEPRIYKL